MSHSKFCRCKLCSSPPDCDSCYPDCCSYHWKNRFCKLRKQWSEHSKCGSIKHSPEDSTHSRSPCDKTIGRFGVAWVAEIPDCEKEEPKGWQIEIKDTIPGISQKIRELIEWLNNPPPHLYDSIKGNETSCRYLKCDVNICDEPREESCLIKDYKCGETRSPKKCRIKCGDDEIIQYLSCENMQETTKEPPPKCSKPIKNYENKCRQEHRQPCEEFSDQECSDRLKTCRARCGKDPQTCDEISDTEVPKSVKKINKCYEDQLSCDECLDKDKPSRIKRCNYKCCIYHQSCDGCSDSEGCDLRKPCKNKYCGDRSSKECSRRTKCRWSTRIPNESDGVFRKESCCCHCQDKFYKNTGTNYDIDIVPQKDHHQPFLRPINSQISDLDSNIICAGIRTSQICKKLKEERRQLLLEKREKELNTVIANNKSSDEETSRSLYVSAQPENTSVINNDMVSNFSGNQRRSSKFRKKESL